MAQANKRDCKHGHHARTCEICETEVAISKQQDIIDELICVLERGLIGTSGLLIQTSDQAAVIKWRKESQELLKRLRSK